MGMNQTPVSERVHIGFFGKRNAKIKRDECGNWTGSLR